MAVPKDMKGHVSYMADLLAEISGEETTDEISINEQMYLTRCKRYEKQFGEFFGRYFEEKYIRMINHKYT